MRTNPPDHPQRHGLDREETMFNPQDFLADDVQVTGAQQIVSLIDGPGERILDWKKSDVSIAARERFDSGGKRSVAVKPDVRAGDGKKTSCCNVAVARFDALIRNSRHILRCSGTLVFRLETDGVTQDSAVEVFDEVAVEIVLSCQFGDACEELAFPLRILQWQRGIIFQGGNVDNEALPFGQRLDNARVDLVELGA